MNVSFDNGVPATGELPVMRSGNPSPAVADCVPPCLPPKACFRECGTPLGLERARESERERLGGVWGGGKDVYVCARASR